MTGAGDKLRLLVVDDDEGMAGTLCDVLGASGYQAEIAFSGGEAVERVKALKPDGILMDLRMPGLDGVEAFREIKRASPASFVIFMTAYAASALVDDARREGAVEVMPKPLDLERVLHLVEKAARETARGAAGCRRPSPEPLA
jgi:CheY-like chemotaxis protein